MAGLVPATHCRNSLGMVSKDHFGVFIAVYMMASKRHGTIYIGVTSELPNRVYKHREGLVPGFTKTYHVNRLVWYERHESMETAIRRETALKKYKREWKCNFIERENPDWNDLYLTLEGIRRTGVAMGGRDKPGHDEYI
jgi:putative endonuclease